MNKRKVRFAENLKILRGKFGLTQEQIGQIIHCERQTVSYWERGITLPYIDTVARLSDVFGITTDDLIFGPRLSITKAYEKDEVEDVMNNNYILKIKKGYHVINDEDIKEFGAWFAFDFAFIMGIVMDLAEREFDIKEVFANGFAIYLPNDDEVKRFIKCMDIIIDKHIHCEEQTADKYTSNYKERVWEIKSKIIDEVKKVALKDDYNKKYFWMDEDENIRGYGDSEKECATQAKIQQCESFTVLENN